MKFEEKPVEEAAAAADDVKPVNDPFVQAMMALGQAFGRDAGLLAVQTIENMKGNAEAVSYWRGKDAPSPIVQGMTEEMIAKLHSVFLVPKGLEPPLLATAYHSYRALKRMMANGAMLILFLDETIGQDNAPPTD